MNVSRAHLCQDRANRFLVEMNPQRRPTGAGGMIGLIQRRVPERHDRITDVLIERAVVREDDVRHLAQVEVHELLELIRAHLFGQIGKAGDVTEQQRQLAPHAAEGDRAAAIELSGDFARDELRQETKQHATLAVFDQVCPS